MSIVSPPPPLLLDFSLKYLTLAVDISNKQGNPRFIIYQGYLSPTECPFRHPRVVILLPIKNSLIEPR